jgi:TolB-like protein
MKPSIRHLVLAACIAAGLAPRPADGAGDRISVAVGDFQNRTDRLYLDSWALLIPEYLEGDLSRSRDVVVVDRERLDAVLDERKLQMTGLTDSTSAREVGRMLSAEYIITGTVSEIGGWVRIDARVTSVATGRMVAENVSARSARHLEQMISLLAGNLRLQMTGRGEYRESLTLRRHPTRPFLAASLACGAAASFFHARTLRKRDLYRDAAALGSFDRAWHSANRWNNARTAALAATGAAAAGVLFCWVSDLSPERVIANSQPILGLTPQGATLGFSIALP